MKIIFMTTVLSVLLLSSCSFFKKSEPVKNTKVRVSPVGRVDKVNQKAGYVFIRKYGSWKLDDSEILETRGGGNGVGRSANLLATGEKIGERVAADIRSGDVKVGDAVFIRKISAAEELKVTLDSL